MEAWVRLGGQAGKAWVRLGRQDLKGWVGRALTTRQCWSPGRALMGDQSELPMQEATHWQGKVFPHALVKERCRYVQLGLL